MMALSLNRGNIGCGVTSSETYNWVEFCLRVNERKFIYIFFSIGILPSRQKFGLLLQNNCKKISVDKRTELIFVTKMFL